MREVTNVVSTTSDLTITEDMDAIIVDASAAPVTLTLPVALQGFQFRVKRNAKSVQFDVDGDSGYNLGPNAFYDFIQQGAMVAVF